MSDYLALDWETHQLCGLEAEVSKSRVRIRQSFCLTWPEDIDPITDPKQAGEWLKEELGRLGIKSKTVLVSLPREVAVVRHLELPNAPDDELPDLVRLQAEMKSATSLDKLHLDFLPLPVSPDAEGRGVLMVTIAAETEKRIRAVLNEAGLEPESVGVSSIATSELIVRAGQRLGFDPNEINLVVSRHGERVEISILRQQMLLFTHSTQLTGDTPQSNHKLILSEVNRSVVALNRLLEGKRIQQGWVIGTDEGSRTLCAYLGEQLNCPVEGLDPFGSEEISVIGEIPENRALFSGPVGMLLAKTGSMVEGIDFLDPRKPVVKPDRTKARMIVAAVGLLLLASGSYGGLQMKLSGLEKQITTTKGKISKIEKKLKDGKPVLKSAAAIGDWDQRNINTLDQMQEFNEILPGTHQIYLSSYQLSAPFSTGDVLVTIEATGQAQSQQQVRSLSQKLRDYKYRVLPQSRPPRGTDNDYPYSFHANTQMLVGHGKKRPKSNKTKSGEQSENGKIVKR